VIVGSVVEVVIVGSGGGAFVGPDVGVIVVGVLEVSVGVR